MTGNPIFGASARGHLGEAAAALVDGVLSHSARDLALAHIAHCAACRAEVEAQRALKLRLASFGGERLDVPATLFASLMSLGEDPIQRVPEPASAMTFTPPAYFPGRRVKFVAATSLAVAAGAGVLLVIGGAEHEPGAPVHPPIATLVSQHVATNGETPITDPGLNAVTAGFVSK